LISWRTSLSLDTWRFWTRPCDGVRRCCGPRVITRGWSESRPGPTHSSFTTRLKIAAWVLRLHTVVRGTLVSGYRQWPPGSPQGRMRACRWGQSLIGDWRADSVRLLKYSPPIRLRSRQLPYLFPRLTDPRPPFLVVSSGHAWGASILLRWFKNFPSIFCRGPEKAQYRRERRFALSAPGNRHPRSMTRGPGPMCHRLGCCFLRRRWRGALPRVAVCSSSARSGSLFPHSETSTPAV
jgi:hypothetical protein